MYIGDFEKLCCVPGAPEDMHRGRAAHMSRKDLWGPSFSPLADLEALHTQEVMANAEL